jgi:phage tail sheath protein FI
MDTGWKYQYDRFSDAYRWVPLNADIAGLSAQVDRTHDVWWSFAGYSRGLIKNVVKLAFNPARKETQRDVLYPMGINPVVSEEGAGTVLLGDTTMTTDSTLFGQIGIRKLFIALERTIGDASKRNLFEFNDEPTQTRFFNSTSKYLRDIQGRRGVADFKVICDSTVNTPIVVESKRFIGKIYVKPNMSINWAELNFTAVGASVAFAEIG